MSCSSTVSPSSPWRKHIYTEYPADRHHRICAATCSLSGRWCLAGTQPISGRTQHIPSSGRGKGRGASSRELEADGAGLAEHLGWAGGADCRSCGHGRPRCFTPVLLRANVPQRNARLLPPNPSALTVKQVLLQYFFSHFFWANCNISAWSLCKEKKTSSKQIKALPISEGKEASLHPCSPPSVTDLILLSVSGSCWS